MDTTRDWNELYSRYLNKQCSAAEARLLLEHFHLEGQESLLLERIEAELGREVASTADTPEEMAAFGRIQRRLMEQVAPTVAMDQRKVKRFRWVSYAAAVIIVVLAGTWFFLDKGARNKEQGLAAATEIPPGGNRATLTLADGRVVDLSEAQTGIVVGDGIMYTDGSAVFSEQVDKSQPHTLTSSQVHTLTTPKGGTYQITLPDGTKVWLNAASTLKYPSRFTGGERVVELEGEAYFEVSERVNKLTSEQVYGGPGAAGSRSQKVPFRVVSKGQVVEVLGTQFNISAYIDEPETKTTLVEGSVKVALTGSTQAGSSDFGLRASDHVLQPGEQAITRGAHTEVQQVDISQYTAWKDGLFSFNETELHTVMNQLSRWYDMEVVYEGIIPSTHYYGVISRNEHLSNILDLLKQSGLHFRVERVGETNRLVVMP